MTEPTIVVGKQLKPPKFVFINWNCPNCGRKNIAKVKLEDITYAIECVSCGAEYRVRVTWPQSSASNNEG